MTPVAIMREPSGKARISGSARKSYTAPAPGQTNSSRPSATPIAIRERISRWRSSTRCEMKLSWSLIRSWFRQEAAAREAAL